MVKRVLVVVAGFVGMVAAIHFAAIAAEPDKPLAPALKGKSAAIEKSAIEKALSQTAVLRFDKTPLNEFAAAIGKQYHVNVLLDHKGLTDAGMGDATPISFELEGGALRQRLAVAASTAWPGVLRPRGQCLANHDCRRGKRARS